MAFTIYCNNKGCGKEQQPFLDVASNDVYCAECGKVIPEVTIFTKNQMKAMGQVKRVQKTQTAFAVECQQCKRQQQPKVIKGKLTCPQCGDEHKHLDKPYAYAIKQFLNAFPRSSE